MSKYQTKTDQTKKIQLPSSIDTVMWTKRAAAPGGTVGLEVFTNYVGNRSDLEIELADNNGKKFGKYNDKISGNHFWASIKIPANANGGLFATVKLPKHGLNQKSPPLLILPPVQITNLKWDKKEVRRGDILKLAADVKGIPDGMEARIEIYEHDEDGAHDFVTKFPAHVKNKKVEAEWEFEYQDDTDDIPTHDELQPVGKNYNPPEYFFRVIIGEVAADSGLAQFKDWIEVRLVDEDGSPIPNEDYVIRNVDGSEKRGKVDDQGCSRVEDMPPGPYFVEFPNLEDVDAFESDENQGNNSKA